MGAMGKNEHQELENFNVRVFYDKLEDQNLHLAAQLARQKEDLDQFYSTICQQNDQLKDLLNQMDPAKLAALEAREAAIVDCDGLQGAAAVGGDGGPTIVNANIKMGGVGGRMKRGGGGREAELMSALKQLLDRLSAGNIPLSPDAWQQLQRQPPTSNSNNATSSVNFFRSGGGQTAAQGELLRQQNGEKMQLERELARTEQEAFDSTLNDLEQNRRRTVDNMMDSLNLKLQGDLSDGEVEQVLSQHEKDLAAALQKQTLSKERQMEELRRRLAEKRRAKELQLRQKHTTEAVDAGLPPPLEGADLTGMTLQTEQGRLEAAHCEETAGQSRADSDTSHTAAQELRNNMSASLTGQIEDLGGQNLIPEAAMRELLKKQRDLEDDLAGKMERRRLQQMEHLDATLARRRQSRLHNMQLEQEKERAQLSTQLIADGHGDDRDFYLSTLDAQHHNQQLALSADLDSDEAEQRRQVRRAVDEDHSAALEAGHRDLGVQLEASTLEKDRLAAQRVMDQHRRDLEALIRDTDSQKNRQLAELQAKLSGRRQRRQQEVSRQTEEDAARRFVNEQTRQLAQGGGGRGVEGAEAEALGADLQHRPQVNYVQSVEEQAMLKEQARMKEELKRRQQRERDALTASLDQEAQREESELTKTTGQETERLLREKRNRNAAELAARSDLSQDQLAELMARHQQEMEALQDKLDSDKSRQTLALRDRLAKNRRRRLEDLRRKQDAELTSEMLEQRGELDDVRLSKAKEVEKAAIEEGIRENGSEDSDKVVQVVLAARHAQEVRDLEAGYQARRRVMVDEALTELHADYDKQRAAMLKRHLAQLADLQKQALSPEEMAERRAALLNRQQVELSDLDQRLAQDEGQVQRTAAADWEVAFARDKLKLKERHYKEFADALREYSPQHDGVSSAEGAAEELEKVKAELEKRRREKEQQLKKEQQDFEKSEEKRLEAEMSSFAQELEQETQKEKDKHERNIDALNRRKEELLEENKQKLQSELARLKAAGSSPEEQEAVLRQHEHHVTTLVSKLEADRLRMTSGLQDRLNKRRALKMQTRQDQLREEAEQQQRQMENYTQTQLQRLKMDETLTLQEALNVDQLSRHDGTARAPNATTTTISNNSGNTTPAQPPVATRAVTSADDHSAPTSLARAAPLDEAELLALLMASPLYQKLDKVKKAVASGAMQGTPASSDGHMDSRDAQWTGDTDLHPVDVSSLDARSFVVYKFGCYVADCVAARCGHPPLTVLLADRLPPNPTLTRNLYRNSFSFDGTNRILWVRAARLDTVGQFLLVLLHSMAHVKSGDLRDDTKPAFVREYQRALAVVCDSLFFAQHQRSSPPSRTLQSVATAMDTDAASARRALQSVFDDAPRGEEARSRVVEDLLDIKVMPEVDAHGRQFTPERVQDRLTKFCNFSMTNQLQGMLGGLEVKVRQAGAQGSSDEVAQQLSQLSSRYSNTGTTVLTRQVAPSFWTASLSGQALWQTFANRLGAEPQEAPASPAPSQSPQDDYDDLCSNFAGVCQQQLCARDAVRRCEQDVTVEMELTERSPGAQRELHAAKQQEAAQLLNAAKSQLEKISAERSRIEKLLQKAAVVGASQPPPQETTAAATAKSSGGGDAAPKASKSGRKGKSKK